MTPAELHAAYVAGESVSSLARRSGLRAQTVQLQVRAFAQAHDLPDPRLAHPTWSVPHPELVVRMARAYQLRAEGHPWRQVAEMAGYTGAQHAMTAARAYALEQRLPWPLKRFQGGTSVRGREAYELRVEGHGWTAIAGRVGYPNADKAMEGARGHARALGRAWPVPTGSSRSRPAAHQTRGRDGDGAP